jgi:sugar lactone lactonase YvrE
MEQKKYPTVRGNMEKLLRKCSVFHLLAGAVILALSGCQVRNMAHSSVEPKTRGVLFEFASVPDQVTGIAMSSQGRIFVSFPRWVGNPRQSVAEVMSDGSIRPFPDTEWNNWNGDAATAGNHFVCVQSVFVDDNDSLWILDPASPGFKGVVQGGAKLVKVNLVSNQVVKVVPFDGTIAPRASYLNDVRIDTMDEVAYITDSGLGAIVVVDLQSNLSRRLLADHPSTKAEPGVVLKINGRELRDKDGKAPQINADGIALDPKKRFLYYHALTGRTLYRIDTRYLKDAAINPSDIGSHVEKLSDTGPVDGMAMDPNFDLYLTSLEDGTIQRYRVYDGSLLQIAANELMQWPDSICIGPDDYLYVTASQINLMPRFNHGVDKRIPPYRLFKIWLAPF